MRCSSKKWRSGPWPLAAAIKPFHSFTTGSVTCSELFYFVIKLAPLGRNVCQGKVLPNGKILDHRADFCEIMLIVGHEELEDSKNGNFTERRVFAAAFEIGLG